jgi:hypothetical protein
MKDLDEAEDALVCESPDETIGHSKKIGRFLEWLVYPIAFFAAIALLFLMATVVSWAVRTDHQTLMQCLVLNLRWVWHPVQHALQYRCDPNCHW